MRKKLLFLAAATGLFVGGAAVAAIVSGGDRNAEAQTTTGGPCGTLASAPSYSHVIWIWMENHSFGDIIGNTQAPYINSLASECGLATNYHNISHPSLPNYIGATSGLSLRSLKPFDSDCSPSRHCSASTPSIVGQGETWKAYEESMPSSCDPSNSGEYAVRHNPPPYYAALPSCATNDVPYTQLASDLNNNALPAFSFVTPNLIGDMHDGTIAQGDSWLASNLPTILNSSEYQSGTTAVFVVWDEGSGGSSGENCATNTSDPSCQVAAIVVSPSTATGTKSTTPFNHYSLLATAEQLLNLPALGLAGSSSVMTSAFNL